MVCEHRGAGGSISAANEINRPHRDLHYPDRSKSPRGFVPAFESKGPRDASGVGMESVMEFSVGDMIAVLARTPTDVWRFFSQVLRMPKTFLPEPFGSIPALGL
jgi:hypothetical protein